MEGKSEGECKSNQIVHVGNPILGEYMTIPMVKKRRRQWRIFGFWIQYEVSHGLLLVLCVFWCNYTKLLILFLDCKRIICVRWCDKIKLLLFVLGLFKVHHMNCLLCDFEENFLLSVKKARGALRTLHNYFDTYCCWTTFLQLFIIIAVDV